LLRRFSFRHSSICSSYQPRTEWAEEIAQNRFYQQPSAHLIEANERSTSDLISWFFYSRPAAYLKAIKLSALQPHLKAFTDILGQSYSLKSLGTSLVARGNKEWFEKSVRHQCMIIVVSSIQIVTIPFCALLYQLSQNLRSTPTTTWWPDVSYNCVSTISPAFYLLLSGRFDSLNKLLILQGVACWPATVTPHLSWPNTKQGYNRLLEYSILPILDSDDIQLCECPSISIPSCKIISRVPRRSARLSRGGKTDADNCNFLQACLWLVGILPLLLYKHVLSSNFFSLMGYGFRDLFELPFVAQQLELKAGVYLIYHHNSKPQLLPTEEITIQSFIWLNAT